MLKWREGGGMIGWCMMGKKKKPLFGFEVIWEGAINGLFLTVSTFSHHAATVEWRSGWLPPIRRSKVSLFCGRNRRVFLGKFGGPMQCKIYRRE